MINFLSMRSFARRFPCVMLLVDSSLIINGIQNVEQAIFPPGNCNEAIPFKATLRTMNPCDQRATDNVFHRNVFPVPLYPYKKIFLLPQITLLS